MFTSNVTLCLLLIALSPLIRADQCENKPYKNLYGCEDFDKETPDPRIILGLLQTLQKAADFAAAAQPDQTPINRQVFDFVVVGAGTAGSAVASRLSEVPGIQVLLIEAGGEEGLHMDIPLNPAYAQLNESLNWNYLTEPSSKFCASMINQQCRWPRGKVMGGTSVFNYMIATRGYKKDFDRWAELGNPGWDYESVLPYFKKLEDMHIPELAADTEYHATGGPVPITYPPFRSPLADAYVKAGEELGLPAVDYNGRDFIGTAIIQTTTVNGTRASSNKAYLHGRRRKNLHVTKDSLVNKILINPKSKKAYGVRYTKNNEEFTVFARNEIILCGGVVGSAQLLMLSGVGPADELKKHGIKVIKDAPVGLNLQDHIGYPGVLYTVDQPVTYLPQELGKPCAPYVKDYLADEKGPLTSIGAVETLMFMDIFDPMNLGAKPNMEQLFLSTSIAADPTLLTALGLSQEIADLLAPINGVHSWAPLPILLKPKSRGVIKLRSANVNDKPIIMPNYLDDPEDVKTFVEGVKFAMTLGETEALKRFNSTLFNLDIEACRDCKDDIDKYIECQIRHLAITVYHPCGTCKMGAPNDPTAVVNPQLQVIGIKRLRVVDASVMPEITSAHPTIAIYMMAEKLADMVKAYWNYPETN